MKTMETYLFFDGNCKEAMTFYKQCLGAELEMMPYSAGPCGVPEGASDRIMHASLSSGKAMLMASDVAPGMPFQQGTNFAININCESLPEIQKLFNAFGEKGKVTMPLADQFWGAHFGMLTDQFGINWMFNYELPKQA